MPADAKELTQACQVKSNEFPYVFGKLGVQAKSFALGNVNVISVLVPMSSTSQLQVSPQSATLNERDTGPTSSGSHELV